MTDIVEAANKLYRRNYVSFSRGLGRFGEVLTFKGTGGELTILESEMQFHLRRAEDAIKPKKSVPANFEKPTGIKKYEKELRNVDEKYRKNIMMGDFSIPTPKLGFVTVKSKEEFFPSFMETTIENLIKYARKQEFDYIYKDNEVSGKAILLEMVQQGNMKMSQYLSILPALENLTDNVEIILE